MAQARGIRAGRAVVELHADKSQLLRGLRRAQYQLSAFGDRLMGIGRRFMMAGVAIGGVLAGMSRSFMQTGDRLEKLNQRTGASVEWLSKMDFAAQRSGGSLDNLERIFRRMAASIYDFERGLTTAAYGFEDLGIALDDIRGQAPEEQFELILTRLGGVADESRRAAIAQRLLGRSGQQILPLIDNYEQLMETAREYGLVVTQEQADAAARQRDALTLVRYAMRSLYVEVGSSLEPAITRVTYSMVKITSAARDWIKDNHDMIHIAGLSSTALLGIGGALMAVGGAFKIAAWSLGIMIVPAKALLGILGALKAILSWKVIAVATVAAGFVKLGGSIEWVSNVLQSAGNYLRDFLGYLAKAFVVGDFKAAWDLFANSAQVAFADIKMGWEGVWHHLTQLTLEGQRRMNRAWTHMAEYIMKTTNIASAGWSAAWEDAWWRMSRRLSWIAEKVPGLGELIAPGVEDFDALNKMLDEYHDEQMRDIDPLYSYQRKLLEEEFEKQRRQIDQLKKQLMDADEEAHKERIKQLLEERQEAIKTLQTVKDLLDGMEVPTFEEQKKEIQELIGMMDVQRVRQAGVGAVGPYALGRMVGNRTEQQIEKNTRTIAENTRQLIRRSEDSGSMVYGS